MEAKEYQGLLEPESNSTPNLWPQEFQNAHGLKKPVKVSTHKNPVNKSLKSSSKSGLLFFWRCQHMLLYPASKYLCVIQWYVAMYFKCSMVPYCGPCYFHLLSISSLKKLLSFIQWFSWGSLQAIPPPPEEANPWVHQLPTLTPNKYTSHIIVL